MTKGRCIRVALLTIAIVLLHAIAAFGQEDTSKQHTAAGITFKYSPLWKVQDEIVPASSGSQQISLSDDKDDAQIMIVVSNAKFEKKLTPEEMKKQALDPWVSTLVGAYEGAGMKVQREDVSSDIAGASAAGTRLRFTFDERKAVGDAFWAIINKKLVILYFLRSEDAKTPVTDGWDLVRASIGPEALSLHPVGEKN